MNKRSMTVLYIACFLGLMYSSVRAKTDKASWTDICKTVRQIVLPTIQSTLKEHVPKDDVVVNIDIDSNGTVTSAQLLSGSPEYGTIFIDAAKKWTFGKGPLSKSIPKKAEINFRFKAAGGNCVILDEKDKLVVIVPAESLDPKLLIAAGATIHSFAAERMPAPFPPNVPKIAGRVLVSVEIDETGRVISAKANSGHPSYQTVAEETSRKWKFREIQLNGNAVRLSGNLVFNWVVN